MMKYVNVIINIYINNIYPSVLSILQTAPKIFGGKITTHLLIFVSKKSDKFDEVLTNIKESAKKNKGKVIDST